MNNVEVPTIEDIYRIAYVTSRGWHFQSYEKLWRRECGLSHTVMVEKYMGDCSDQVPKETDLWTLEDAYWTQRGIDEVEGASK
jgi:hypothetical protein